MTQLSVDWEDGPQNGCRPSPDVSVVIPTLGWRSTLVPIVNYYLAISEVKIVVVVGNESVGRVAQVDGSPQKRLRVVSVRASVGESPYQYLARRIAAGLEIASTDFCAVVPDDDPLTVGGIRRSLRSLSESQFHSVVVGRKIFWDVVGTFHRRAVLVEQGSSQVGLMYESATSAVDRLAVSNAIRWRCWSIGRAKKLREYWQLMSRVPSGPDYVLETVFHFAARLMLPAIHLSYPVIFRRDQHPHHAADDGASINGRDLYLKLTAFSELVLASLPLREQVRSRDAMMSQIELALSSHPRGMREQNRKETFRHRREILRRLPCGWRVTEFLRWGDVSQRQLQRWLAVSEGLDDQDVQELRRDFRAFSQNFMQWTSAIRHLT